MRKEVSESVRVNPKPPLSLIWTSTKFHRASTADIIIGTWSRTPTELVCIVQFQALLPLFHELKQIFLNKIRSHKPAMFLEYEQTNGHGEGSIAYARIGHKPKILTDLCAISQSRFTFRGFLASNETGRWWRMVRIWKKAALKVLSRQAPGEIVETR